MSEAMSERQRYWYEHLQRAKEQSLSLSQYAREQGLTLKQLYGAKTWLMKLGHWPRASVKPAAASEVFVPVQLARTQTTACRLRHDSGWVLECEGADARWWGELLQAMASPHASA